jgi:hypothetical protein
VSIVCVTTGPDVTGGADERHGSQISKRADQPDRRVIGTCLSPLACLARGASTTQATKSATSDMGSAGLGNQSNRRGQTRKSDGQHA